MADNETLAYDIVANYDGSGAKNAASDLGDLKAGAENAGGAVGALGNILQIAGGVALGEIFLDGLHAAVDGLGDFVSSAMAAEDATAKLSAMLDLAGKNGNAAGLTLDGLNGLAETLAGKTRFDDEAIKGVIATLLKFQDVSADAIPQTTQSVLDLATAMGTDATTAAQQLGRALENPASAGRIFAQAGFSKELQDQIKELAKQGDVAQADKLILDGLSQTVGGLAEKMGETTAGRIQILTNRLDDMRNEVVGKLLPVLADAGDALLNFLDSPAVQAAIAQVEAWLTDLVGAIQNFFSILQQYGIGQAIANLFGLNYSVGAQIQQLFDDTFGAVLGKVRNFISTLQSSGLSQALAGLFNLNYNVGSQGVGAVLQKVFDDLVAQVQAIDWNSIFNNLGNLAQQLTQTLETQIGQVDWEGVKQKVFAGLATLGQLELKYLGTLADIGIRIAGYIADRLNEVDWTRVVAALGDGLGAALQGAGSLLDKVANYIGSIDWGKVFDKIGDSLGGKGGGGGAKGGGNFIDKIADSIGKQFATINWDNVWQGAGDIAGRIGDGLLKVLQGGHDLTVKIQGWLYPQIQAALDGLGAALSAGASKMGNDLQTFFKTAFTAAITSATGILNSFAATISGAITTASQNLKNIWDGIVKTLQGVVDAIRNGILGAFDDLVAKVAEIAAPIMDFLNNTLAPLRDVLNAVLGIIQGIVDWLGKLADALSGIKMPSWAIHNSPSEIEQTFGNTLYYVRELAGVLPTLRFPSVTTGMGGGVTAPAIGPGAGGGIHIYNPHFTGNDPEGWYKQFERLLNERWGADAANAASMRV